MKIISVTDLLNTINDPSITIGDAIDAIFEMKIVCHASKYLVRADLEKELCDLAEFWGYNKDCTIIHDDMSDQSFNQPLFLNDTNYIIVAIEFSKFIDLVKQYNNLKAFL